MSLQTISSEVTETLIDLFLLIYYIFESIIVFFIPNKFLLKSVEKSIILITGGGSGIGRALAVGFAKRGAIIVLWDINKSGLDQTVQLVESVNGIVFSFLCDITDKQAVYETATKVRQNVGFVSILINNAGIVYGKDFLQIPDEKIIQTFNVNVISHFWLHKAFLPDMLERNCGHLVSIASVAGLLGVAGLTDYCASKFAVMGFDESIRMELVRDGYDGIKSTIVCPYYINTGLFKGVKTPLVPILDTDYVSEKIISAVLTNQNIVLIPKMMYALCFIKSILPINSFLQLNKILRANKTMTNQFEGRNKKTIIYDTNRNFINLEDND